MNKRIIFQIAIVTGLALGGFAISAVAAWTTAPSSPPACPDTIEGCNAPLNVGSSDQVKTGVLTLGALFLNTGSPERAIGLSVFGKTILNGSLQLKTGAGVNKVLTSVDAEGNVAWKTTTDLFGEGGATPTEISKTNSYSATATDGDDNTTIMDRDSEVCLLTGIKTTSSSGSSPSQCYITGNNNTELNKSLTAYAGANDTVTCTAICLNWVIGQ
ncbi:MAG: hypothetical protein WC648_03530 [Candidatus Paceibacterota bacterium]|jgi:hypothetical protein